MISIPPDNDLWMAWVASMVAYRRERYAQGYKVNCPDDVGHPTKQFAMRDSWTPGDDDQILGVQINSRRAAHYHTICARCGDKSASIGHGSMVHWDPARRVIKWVREYDPTRYARVGHLAKPACSVEDCSTGGYIDWHHIAPRALFADADSWPIIALCQEHHTGRYGWHQMMTGFNPTYSLGESYPPDAQCQYAEPLHAMTSWETLFPRRSFCVREPIYAVSLEPWSITSQDVDCWPYTTFCFYHLSVWTETMRGYAPRGRRPVLASATSADYGVWRGLRSIPV